MKQKIEGGKFDDMATRIGADYWRKEGLKHPNAPTPKPQKIEGGMEEKSFNNPSYDKSLSVRDRLGDFMGKYHVVLNGVVKHDPYEMAEVDGGGMCCQRHKVEILDFVDLLLSTEIEKAKASERQRCGDSLPGEIEHPFDERDSEYGTNDAFAEGFNECLSQVKSVIKNSK